MAEGASASTREWVTEVPSIATSDATPAMEDIPMVMVMVMVRFRSRGRQSPRKSTLVRKARVRIGSITQSALRFELPHRNLRWGPALESRV